MKNNKTLNINKIRLIILTVAGFFILYLFTTQLLKPMHSFLSLTRPVKSNVLIVEGWLFNYMLEDAAKEIKKNKYTLIITTGTDQDYKENSKCKNLKNSADCCKRKLILLGINEASIHAVSAGKIKYENTYKTALAVKQWIKGKNIKSVNVFTGGAHGRKSLVLFQKALGKNINVGVISCKIKHYDSSSWWTSARGTWNTFRYFVGYLYALVR